MGKKGGRSYQKKEVKNSKTSSQYKRDAYSSDDMDDEIDTFHKQRDIVPLNINDGTEESDEDEELPIFDVKDVDDEDDDEDDDDDEDEEDGGNDDLAKMIRQRKYLRSKFGGGDDTIVGDEDEDEDEEGYKLTLGGKKFSHGAENRNFELQSSDDEAPKEEEELALQIQREKAKSLTMEDYDLVDLSGDKDNEKLTLKASDKGNEAIKPLDRDIIFSVDELNALTTEEQMNALYRSAPELVVWLSELNEAHRQLECEINPFLSKVKTGEIVMKGEVGYFELKQLILLSYCQAVTFYLLLKSEGQSVSDHPITARLEEIKKLSDQIKQLDRKLPVELEDILVGNNGLETALKSDNESSPMAIDSIIENQELPPVSAKSKEETVPSNQDMQKLGSSKGGVQKTRKVKPQKDHIGAQSLEMLKVRAALEEKLKKKGLYVAPKPSNGVKRSRPVNGQLETYDDFNDGTEDVNGEGRLINGSSYKKVSRFLNANMKKPKVVSGDDDLPKRDEIGERRRKHELRVLAGAGIMTEEDDDNDKDDQMGGDLGPDEIEDADDDDDDVGSGDSENEFYKQVEQLRAAKLAAKAANSRNTSVSSQAETVEGKRLISSQMVKNRGLTRNRNKAKKNPRKNYKLKHQKAVKNRKGQVQSIRRPTAPYGGESSGINAAVSRSIRFKS